MKYKTGAPESESRWFYSAVCAVSESCSRIAVNTSDIRAEGRSKRSAGTKIISASAANPERSSLPVMSAAVRESAAIMYCGAPLISSAEEV